jgi:hypothetical protein
MSNLNFDATTPELKLAKRFLEAYQSFDTSNIASLVSKDYKFQMFPKIPHNPQETKEQHFEKYGALLSVLLEMT